MYGCRSSSLPCNLSEPPPPNTHTNAASRCLFTPSTSAEWPRSNFTFPAPPSPTPTNQHPPPLLLPFCPDPGSCIVACHLFYKTAGLAHSSMVFAFLDSTNDGIHQRLSRFSLSLLALALCLICLLYRTCHMLSMTHTIIHVTAFSSACGAHSACPTSTSTHTHHRPALLKKRRKKTNSTSLSHSDNQTNTSFPLFLPRLPVTYQDLCVWLGAAWGEWDR